MSRVDIAELRRLLADDAPIRWAQNAAAVWNALPALLDELEAAREELQGWRHERAMTIEAFRLIQTGLDPKLIGHPNGSEFGDALRAMLDARDRRHKLIGAAEELRRLTQANGDLRKERDRAVKEAQRQDGVAKGLRAELAAAKEENAKMRATIISAMVDVQHNLPGNGHAKLSLLLDGIMKAPRNNEERLLAERDRLAADNARLREALEEIAALAEEDISALTGVAGQMVCKLCGNVPHDEKCPHTIATAALAATPAQSIAAHDAALLREVAVKWYRSGPSNAAVLLEDEADRIEKEAVNGKTGS